jgi:hypothetical protein
MSPRIEARAAILYANLAKFGIIASRFWKPERRGEQMVACCVREFAFTSNFDAQVTLAASDLACDERSDGTMPARSRAKLLQFVTNRS